MQKNHEHDNEVCVILTDTKLAAFMMTVIFVLAHIDITYGYQLLLKLSAMVLSWPMQDAVGFAAAFIMSNMGLC